MEVLPHTSAGIEARPVAGEGRAFLHKLAHNLSQRGGIIVFHRICLICQHGRFAELLLLPRAEADLALACCLAFSLHSYVARTVIQYLRRVSCFGVSCDMLQRRWREKSRTDNDGGVIGADSVGESTRKDRSLYCFAVRSKVLLGVLLVTTTGLLFYYMPGILPRARSLLRRSNSTIAAETNTDWTDDDTNVAIAVLFTTPSQRRMILGHIGNGVCLPVLLMPRLSFEELLKRQEEQIVGTMSPTSH